MLFCLLLAAHSGCGGSSNNEPGANSSDIVRYMQENPEMVARPEDSPGEYADEVAAGRD